MTAPMTVDAVMALALKLCCASADCGVAVDEEGQAYSDALNVYTAAGDALRAAVELLAQQARDKALEDAEQACRGERVAAEETQMPEDFAYNDATEHCEIAIRALKTAAIAKQAKDRDNQGVTSPGLAAP